MTAEEVIANHGSRYQEILQKIVGEVAKKDA